MRAQLREILGLAVFYIVVVALLDFFLREIPVINWLALIVAFIFFTGLILGTVTEFRPKKRHLQEYFPETYDDEIERLGKTIEKALQKHESESLKILQQKLQSIAVKAHSRHTNQSLSAGTEYPPATFTADDQSLMPRTEEDVRKMLSRIEDWLA